MLSHSSSSIFITTSSVVSVEAMEDQLVLSKSPGPSLEAEVEAEVEDGGCG